MSLAGRTATPVTMPVPVRTGGFGGAAGLAAFLHDERIDALVDATHPFAAAMSVNAAAAAAGSGTPLVVLRRPPWTPVTGDRWIDAGSIADAAGALGAAPRRVFLALGRNEIAAFEAAPQHHYLVRSVDPVVPPPALPHAAYLTARGPFAEAAEHALLKEHRIDLVCCKNSGGAAAYGKIAAARALALPVIVVRRPAVAAVAAATAILDSVDAMVRALGRLSDRRDGHPGAQRPAPATPRGV